MTDRDVEVWLEGELQRWDSAIEAAAGLFAAVANRFPRRRGEPAASPATLVPEAWRRQELRRARARARGK